MNQDASDSLPDVGNFTKDPYRSFSLPGTYYFDPQIYSRELDRIFYRTWQYVCHQSSIPEPGDYHVREIGDQSIFVVRTREGEILGFHNVCQHRAHRLLEGSGKVSQAIVCPYHNWAYRLTGELRHARHSDEILHFDADEIRLAAVKVEMFCGFVFVNLDPAAQPMAAGLRSLRSEILELSPDVETLKLAYNRDIDLKANWKNSVENYCECYHCPNQHPGLAEGAVDMSAYQITVHEHFHSHASISVGQDMAYAAEQHRTADGREFGSWFIWPNFCVEVYPGGHLNVFNHVPGGPEKTIQETEWYFPTDTPTPDQQQAIDFVDVVRNEDIPLCESVQRGLHSFGYSQGRLVANKAHSYFSEHAIHDFQTKVVNALGLQ